MSSVQERHPYAFVARNDDPTKRQRKVAMEVLSCGYSRTGTMTMKAALETLGIPTWHWVEMGANPPDMDLWSEALLAKFTNGRPFGRPEFDMLLGNWGAVTDQPAAILCEELINAYPGAKVVLVERDVDEWYKSFSETVIAGSANPWIPLASYLDPLFMRRTCYQTDVLIKHYFHVAEPRAIGLFNNPRAFDQWRKNACETYRSHNEMVRRVTPKDKLLVFKFNDGWAPLCKFLDKPIPDISFPRVNETAAAQEMITAYILQSYKRALIKFATVVLPGMLIVVAMILWKMRV